MLNLTFTFELKKSVIFLSTDCDPMCQDEIFTL